MTEDRCLSVCCFCGKPYGNHLDSRPPEAPVPRMGCTGLKSGFRPRQQPSAPPAPLPGPSNRERLLIALQTVTDEECGSLLHTVEEWQRAKRANAELRVADTIPAPPPDQGAP